MSNQYPIEILGTFEDKYSIKIENVSPILSDRGYTLATNMQSYNNIFIHFEIYTSLKNSKLTCDLQIKAVAYDKENKIISTGYKNVYESDFFGFYVETIKLDILRELIQNVAYIRIFPCKH